MVGFKVHNMRDGGERLRSACDSKGSSLLACFTKQREAQTVMQPVWN